MKKEIDKIKIDSIKINLVMFEKDDDSNGHIDFIFSFSNIKARNYNIKEIEDKILKWLSDNIIPAMTITTAAIARIVNFQLYTFHQTKEIKNFRIVS